MIPQIAAAMQGVTHLDHSVRVYVPSTVDVNRKTDNAKYVDDTASALSTMFGGATIYPQCLGCWMSSNTGLVKEDVDIVESKCDESSLVQHIADVRMIASKLKEDMSQESVALEIDGELFLV